MNDNFRRVLRCRHDSTEENTRSQSRPGGWGGGGGGVDVGGASYKLVN